MRKTIVAGFAAGLIVGIASTLGAMHWMSGVSAAERNSSRVVLENDRVVVKEAIFMPGDRQPGMHTHKYAHVGVPVDGGKLQFKYPDGKTETADLKPGAPGFREANVTHEAINMGKKPVRVIEVEIK
ncbi:MAG: hypothetical protein H0T92_00535 [Pyrinomonadaceae bacterium]|nr:hypothetical protein [Pyrinomonadaceae bacterium]